MGNSADLKTYDLENRVITFGAINMEGFGDGEFATIEWNGPAFTYKEGGDGEMVRSKAGSRGGVFKIRLLQTSQANTKLSAAHLLDYKAKNGAGIAPIQFADLVGTTLFHADKAYIEGPPNFPVGAEVGTLEWSIRFANGEITIAGS